MKLSGALDRYAQSDASIARQVDVLSGHFCNVSHPYNQEACEQGLKESWGTIVKAAFKDPQSTPEIVCTKFGYCSNSTQSMGEKQPTCQTCRDITKKNEELMGNKDQINHLTSYIQDVLCGQSAAHDNCAKWIEEFYPVAIQDMVQLLDDDIDHLCCKIEDLCCE